MVPKPNAHLDRITSLCILSGNRLISGSNQYNIPIKVNELTLIKAIAKTLHHICKNIPLTNERLLHVPLIKQLKYGKTITYMNVYLHYNMMLRLDLSFN